MLPTMMNDIRPHLFHQFFIDLIEDSGEILSRDSKTHGITFEISDKFLIDDLTAGLRGIYFMFANFCKLLHMLLDLSRTLPERFW